MAPALGAVIVTGSTAGRARGHVALAGETWAGRRACRSAGHAARRTYWPSAQISGRGRAGRLAVDEADRGRGRIGAVGRRRDVRVLPDLLGLPGRCPRTCAPWRRQAVGSAAVAGLKLLLGALASRRSATGDPSRRRCRRARRWASSWSGRAHSSRRSRRSSRWPGLRSDASRAPTASGARGSSRRSPATR